ncbi:Putative zinc-finger [Franzmannia pantelleriensis]|uniref:Putative zinc-finger n=1 Tax=Franzmannia pantelleriensis TaxID=48727 RepID=A0A1G9JJX5_9GAMM|nr:zf-HC2 domain-containing protein [Halomonas pantelleriensis]SDL37393.1 Putative zinc-finger [Halomonas pantelleriensis]
MMMMCKEATRLMSLKQDRRLTFQERLSLRLHLAMCGACRECDRQFSLLNQAGQRFEADLGKRLANDESDTTAPDDRQG